MQNNNIMANQMRIYTISDIKSGLTEILAYVHAGGRAGIASARGGEILALLVPPTGQASGQRVLGLLADTARVRWDGDGKITEAEFLGV